MSLGDYASLMVRVYADTRPLKTAVKADAEKTGEEAGAASGASFGSKFASTMMKAMAVVGAAELVKKVVDAGEEAAKVTAATEAVIKATGGAAHVTASQVGELAAALMRKTGVDDETIRQASTCCSRCAISGARPARKATSLPRRTRAAQHVREHERRQRRQ